MVKIVKVQIWLPFWTGKALYVFSLLGHKHSGGNSLFCHKCPVTYFLGGFFSTDIQSVRSTNLNLFNVHNSTAGKLMICYSLIASTLYPFLVFFVSDLCLLF